MRSLTIGLLVIVGITALVTGAIVAHKEGYMGGGYVIVIESYWDGKTIDGTVLNNSTRKVRCVQAEFDLVDKNDQQIDTVYYETDAALATGDSLSFSLSAAADGARSLRHTNTLMC